MPFHCRRLWHSLICNAVCLQCASNILQYACQKCALTQTMQMAQLHVSIPSTSTSANTTQMKRRPEADTCKLTLRLLLELRHPKALSCSCRPCLDQGPTFGHPAFAAGASVCSISAVARLQGSVPVNVMHHAVLHNAKPDMHFLHTQAAPVSTRLFLF